MSKSFGILIEVGDLPKAWDTFGMEAVKSFGILIEGYRGWGWVIIGNRPGANVKIGIPLGWDELSPLES